MPTDGGCDPTDVTLREYLLSVMDERERRLDNRYEEQSKRLDERWMAQKEAISKAEDGLAKTLIGFPQTYALKIEVDRIRDDLNQIRVDHVQRSELDRLRDETAALREIDSKQASQYLERNYFEATVQEWLRWRSGVDQTLAQMAGRGTGVENLSDLVFRSIPIIIAAISTIAAIYFASGR